MRHAATVGLPLDYPEQINLMMPHYSYRHCSSYATWQSMQRFSFLERRSKQKGRLDCHVASLLAMTHVIRYALSFLNVL
jgi:hypothetical protein